MFLCELHETFVILLSVGSNKQTSFWGVFLTFYFDEFYGVPNLLQQQEEIKGEGLGRVEGVPSSVHHCQYRWVK